MSRFFGRRYRLLVQQNPVLDLHTGGFVGPLQDNSLPGSPALGSAFTVITTPLRIQFKVEKNLYTPPNTAEITVTNLSEHTRNALQQFGALVTLEAGYQDQLFLGDDGANHLPTLFKGTARTIDPVRDGKEWNVRIQCGDGELAYRYADASLSAAPGAPYSDIAGKLAQTLQPAGVDISKFLSQLSVPGLITFPRQQFVTGYAVSGNAMKELQKLLAPTGWAVSIQDGQLQVVARGGSTGELAVLISEGSGMVGSPDHGTPDKNGLQSMLKVKSLLLPTLGPGDPFVLQARDNSGNYSAQKVKHTGDSHAAGDDSWCTEIESYPLGGPTAAVG